MSVLRPVIQTIRRDFLQYTPDFVAYDNRGEVLYIGEITVSGYLGRKGRNFHIGGVRKLAEVFTKFYLFNIEDNRKMIIQRLKQVHENIHLKKVSCHLVIPEKSKFIKAIGYRNKLLETDIIKLDMLPLTARTEKTVTETLQNAKDEMK